MNPAQRISRLEDLERNEQRSQRTAARVAWTTVALAAVVTGVMIVAAYFQLSSIRSEIAMLTAQKKKLEAETQWLEKENNLKEKALWQIESPPMAGSSAQVATSTVPAQPQPARPVQVESGASAIAPRIYMHILDQQDRGFAQRIGRQLTGQNYVVLGPEYLPNSVPSRRTEVRYYKKADAEAAESIAAMLRDSGAPGARAVYLSRFENSTAVRPKHFEIWFPAGVSAVTRARPSTAP